MGRKRQALAVWLAKVPDGLWTVLAVGVMALVVWLVAVRNYRQQSFARYERWQHRALSAHWWCLACPGAETLKAIEQYCLGYPGGEGCQG